MNVHTPTLHEVAHALHVSGYHAEYYVMLGLIEERDVRSSAGTSPAMLKALEHIADLETELKALHDKQAEPTLLTPAAKELVALIFDHDLIHRGYMQDVAELRKQCSKQTQNINELATTLERREDRINELEKAYDLLRLQYDLLRQRYAHQTQCVRDALRTTSVPPAAQELAALNLDYTLLREQCAQQTQNINELATTLTARDDEIARFKERLQQKPTGTEIDAVVAEIITAVRANDMDTSVDALNKIHSWFDY